MERLARFAFSFFAGAKCTEVFNCFRNIVAEKSHCDSASIFTIDLNVEVNLGSHFGISSTDLLLWPNHGGEVGT